MERQRLKSKKEQYVTIDVKLIYMLLETKIKTETFLPEKTCQTTSTVSQIKSENFQSHDC